MPRKKKILDDAHKMGDVNCGLLNVRKEPSKDSESVKVIRKFDRVVIDEDYKHDDWYKLIKVNRKVVDGYVMKQFIDEI